MSLTTNQIAALFTELLHAPAHLGSNEYPAVARLHNERVDYGEEGLTTLPRGWLIETLLGGSDYGPTMSNKYFEDWMYHLGMVSDYDDDTDAQEIDDYLIGWAMSFDEAMGYYNDLDGETQMSVLNILGWGDGSEPAGDPSQGIIQLEDCNDPMAVE